MDTKRLAYPPRLPAALAQVAESLRETVERFKLQ